VQSGYGTGYFIVAFVYAALRAYFGGAFAVVGWRVLFATALVARCDNGGVEGDIQGDTCLRRDEDKR